MNNYSDKEYEIFSRLFILNEFSEKNLELLSNLKIGIVGIGGIGCPLSQYLVSSGIKKLIIADGDVVEISNLNRQILFNLNDVGEKKTKAAKNKLKLVNNECVIDTIDQNIDSNNLIHFAECSIIVDATDDWNTSKLLNEFCVNNSINFLYSSALKHDIQVILFNNTEKQNHICLNCIFPNKDDVDLPRCSSVGISGISAGLAGLITAQKIINFSLNLMNETNIITVIDGKKLSIDNIIIKSKHDCYLNKIYDN